jgi:hypothetical protein
MVFPIYTEIVLQHIKLFHFSLGLYFSQFTITAFLLLFDEYIELLFRNDRLIELWELVNGFRFAEFILCGAECRFSRCVEVLDGGPIVGCGVHNRYPLFLGCVSVEFSFAVQWVTEFTVDDWYGLHEQFSDIVIGVGFLPLSVLNTRFYNNQVFLNVP